MKFGVRECADVVLKAKSQTKIGAHTFKAGEPVIYFDTVKTSTMESAATSVYATGGKGNSRLLAWEGEKTLTFTFEDALISPRGLAILSGADLIHATGTTKIYPHKTETVVAGASGAVALTGYTNVYVDGDAYVMLLDNNGEMSGAPVKVEITAAGAITIPDGITIDKDALVMVDFYTEETSDAQEILITPDQFAGYYYLEASTLFRRQVDGKDLPAEFVIPKLKIQSNFSFTLAATGDPSTFTFTADAFPDYLKYGVGKTKKVLAAIQVIGANDNYDAGADLEEVSDDMVKKVYNIDDGSYLIREDDEANYDTEDTGANA